MDVVELGVNWTDFLGRLNIRYEDGSYDSIEVLLDFASIGPSIDFAPIIHEFDHEITLENTEGKKLSDVIDRIFLGGGAR